MKVCCVVIVLMFFVYNYCEYCFDIYICLLMDDLVDVDDVYIVWCMNEEVELLVKLNLE